MGSIDLALAGRLRERLGLARAVETGTYQGATTRELAGVFPTVITIELSEELHRDAVTGLRDLTNVTPLQGHSADRLSDVADPEAATLFFLDGHWSGGVTAGADDECPVLRELAAIGAGNPEDCIFIDDARLFLAAPPPPHDPEAWPTLLDVINAIRADRPDHHITVLEDQIVAVPQEGKPIIDAHGRALLSPEAARPSLLERLRQAAGLRARKKASRIPPTSKA
jgi:hypothetical protein